MSYIGQGLPADSFQGFTTDSFTGDGSATTFTLSKKPFDESALLVVINNVVQKPTTNFTVSGTTLTIVGTAVADGDVIYATHMGGALPIGEAASLTSNILTSQTDIGAAIADADLFLVDDGAGGTLRKVAASRIKTYAGGALAGIDDQSSSNDDQLTITDTSVVINEDSDDVDFRVESNGSANMLFVDGGNDEVVIQKASSGATATAGSVLIVEDDDNTELSILGGSSSVLALNFGHSGDADEAIIAYNTTSGSENMSFTVGASERFRLRKGDAKTAEVTSAATTDTTSALHLSKPNETHSSSTRMIGFEVGGQGRGNILNGTSD